MFDVAIVGYGPVGKLLSILLAKRGHRVVAIDRFDTVYPLPRAVHFDDETGRLLDQAGIGEAVRKICVTRQAPAEFLSAEGNVLIRLEPDPKPASGWPSRNFFHQPELEQIMADHAATLSMLTFRGGQEVVGLSQDDSGVALQVRRFCPDSDATESQTETIRARYVVGCDGANSLVRQYLDSPVHELDFAHAWLVVDFLREPSPAWPEAGRQYCDPDRPTTYVPLGPKAFRMEFMLRPGEGEADFKDPAVVASLVERAGLPGQGINVVRQAIYTFRANWLERWQTGGIFVAGDAAHLTPPFLGQGLCSGLRDAATLAWKLSFVLHGTADATTLPTYTSERKPHVATLIRNAVDFGEVICVSDRREAAARDDRMLRDGVKTLPAVPRPRLGAGISLAGDANAGLLMPQGRVAAGGEPRQIDQIQDGGFLLIGLDADPLANLSADELRYLSAVGVRALHFGGDKSAAGDSDGVFVPWLKSLQCAVALVRPDLYVFGTAANATGLNTLVRTLRGQLGTPVQADTVDAVGIGQPSH